MQAAVKKAMQHAKDSQMKDDDGNDWLQDAGSSQAGSSSCHVTPTAPSVDARENRTMPREAKVENAIQSSVDGEIGELQPTMRSTLRPPAKRLTADGPTSPREIRQMGKQERKRHHQAVDHAAALNSITTPRNTHPRRRGCAADDVAVQGGASRPTSAARGSESACEELDDNERAVITVMPSCDEEVIVNQALKNSQVEIAINTEEGMELVLDDITWEPMCSRLVGVHEEVQGECWLAHSSNGHVQAASQGR